MMNLSYKTIFALCILCIAMAAVESAVVVYLRALYYPEGFTIMFKIIDQKIILVEIAREAATVIMLMTIGYLAGSDFKSRFAYFLMAFATWDIFYYVWLKVFIDWPASWVEWDILFLIPFTWLGPVLAPVICSVMMFMLALVILQNNQPITKATWALLVLGSSFILYTFLNDYGRIIIENDFLEDYLTIMQNERFIDMARNYVPSEYNWSLFTVGLLFIFSSIANVFLRKRTVKIN